ncbi:MAG: T9SS type A sorting domain-containing protein [Bacteroidia bacterium]
MDAQGCTWNDTLLLSILPDYVWPGDANHDGLADNQDILYMGLAMGSTGASRAGATTSWYGQTCTNWGQVFPNSADYKHADADGNGTVMFADTAIVVQNYGLTHNKGNGVTGGVPLQFVPLQTSYSAGDTLRIGIDLGDVGNPATNTNGIYYSVMVSGISTSPGDVWLEFPQGLLGSNGVDMVALGIEDVAPGRHDVGQSRVGASPVTGFGRIAVLNIVTDTIMLPNANNSVVLDFGNATLVDPNLAPIALASAPLTLNVTGGSVGIDPIGSSSISLYPVPADGMVHLHASGHHGISAVRIYDLSGKECMALNLENETLSIPVVDLPQGSYLLGLTTQGGDRQWKRFTVIHGR